MNLDEFTIAQLAEDVRFLAERADGANKCSFMDYERDTGVSSNAIVRLAYGGEPPHKHELPSDKQDLMACQRAFNKLPEHRKTVEVRAALDRAWNAITK